MSQRNLLIVLLAVVVSYACYVRGEQNPFARFVAEGLAAVDDGALDSVPDDELFNGAMTGMVDVLRRRGDEHSQFLAEEEAAPMLAEIRQQFGGIGVRLGFEGEPPRLTIVGPPDPGAPADRAHLLPGDTILSIDGQSTAGMTMTNVLRLMRGDPGSTLKLVIQHEHQTESRTVELVREVINIESILGDRRGVDRAWEYPLESDPRIAHIRIASFGERTAEEFRSVMEQLMDSGTQAVILDLRDNAGGALDAAVAICEMLLPHGKKIVETRGRSQVPRQRYISTKDGPYMNVPLAVVVNGNSASAAEIVAACLQDHGRAIIVGERTYGKGTVQQLVPLESGRSLLKLTWASFWRPSGEEIHRGVGAAEGDTWGIAPNAGYERKLSKEEYAAYRKFRTERDLMRPIESESSEPNESATLADFSDEQLLLAVEYLQGEIGEQAERAAQAAATE